MNRFKAWLNSCAHSEYAHYVLGLLFYIEAILFLPADPMLIFYCMQRKDNALKYTFIATFASVLGGLTAYAIGFMLWDIYGEQIIHSSVIKTIISPERFHSLSAQYQKNIWFALLIPALIPIIPYKTITLSAGFCHLSLIPFIICSCIVRGSRYLLYATLITRYQGDAKTFMKQSFSLIMTLGLITIISTIWFLQ